MTKMTAEEKQQFLSELHVGVIGINNPGHAPLTVPIWYDYIPGGSAWVITGANSRKGNLLAPGTQVSLAAQDEAPPYTYVSIESVVSAITQTTESELVAMAIRYLGEDMGKQYAANAGTDGQITVHLDPQKWLAVDYGKAS